ncbi:hypothetical protein [Methanoregula sp.]|jgi:hypothetical protein|uniref:hypothetical protein n=1 Tax=Methanoregula sp. TaxID=2052170 RepID=UPI003C7105A5
MHKQINKNLYRRTVIRVEYMTDNKQADLIKSFVNYLITSQKIEVFNYAIFVNKEKDAFFVNAVPHFPLVRLKIDNDKNKKSIEVALQVTETAADKSWDSLDRVCSFEVSVTMDEKGKLRVHTDLSKDAVFAQLPAPVTDAIKKVYFELEKSNAALQDQFQAWYDEHAR